MAKVSEIAKYVWQSPAWPNFKFSRAALADELSLFAKAFAEAKRALKKPQPLEDVASAMTEEAVRTSAIEGVEVNESVVMSSICRALGVAYAPAGFPKDARAEGVAQMMLSVRRDWDKPLSVQLLKDWHGSLLANDPRGLKAGAFRDGPEPMRVVRTNAFGEMEIRYEAPPSERVPGEIDRFAARWREVPSKPADIALKAAFMHPHFESIHPFEDGNGRVGRALVAKTLAEGLGLPLVLPVSTVIARHRRDYYEEINAASQSLDWTSWAAFFIPVLAETLTDCFSSTRYRLNCPLCEPIDPINDPISGSLGEDVLRLVTDNPGINRERLAFRVGRSVETVKRAIAALVAAGRIEHRGSKKTGGYFPLEQKNEDHTGAEP